MLEGYNPPNLKKVGFCEYHPEVPTFKCSGLDCNRCDVKEVCNDKVLCGECHVQYLKSKGQGFRKWYYTEGKKKIELLSMLRAKMNKLGRKIKNPKDNDDVGEITAEMQKLDQKIYDIGQELKVVQEKYKYIIPA